jgi:hypothetical protein
MKIKLTASGSLTNTSTSGYCAQIQGSLVSSTGPSDSENSGIVTTSGTASIGSGNSLFVNVTVPGAGYVTINTTLFTVNSTASATSGTLTIFEVNGSATSITQSVCVQNTTGVVSCGTAPLFDIYYADMYYCSSCGAGPVTVDFLVAFTPGTTVTINDFYQASVGSGYEGTATFKLKSLYLANTNSVTALIMSADHASTCTNACALAPA